MAVPPFKIFNLNLAYSRLKTITINGRKDNNNNGAIIKKVTGM